MGQDIRINGVTYGGIESMTFETRSGSQACFVDKAAVDQAAENIAASIADKGVYVPDTAELGDMPRYIDRIKAGLTDAQKVELASLLEQANDVLAGEDEQTLNDAVLALIERVSALEALAPHPMLVAGTGWYKGTTAKNTITRIDIVDSYTPPGSATSWNADTGNTGSIKCYITGTVLTIAGNGSGKIMANPNSSFLFSGFSAVTRINGAELLDTSQVTTMEKVFNQLYKLEYVDVSSWDTSRVTTMYCMFQLCYSLKALDLSKWDVSRVTDFGNFLMGHTAYADQSPSGTGFTEIRTLGDISHWDVRSCANFTAMFAKCAALRELDLSGWDMATASGNTEFAMTNMLYDCQGLHKLTLGDRWVTKDANLRAVANIDSGSTGLWYDANGGALPYGGGHVLLPDGAGVYTSCSPSQIPTLAEGHTWYKGSTLRGKITEIEVVQRYTPTGAEKGRWDASDAATPGTVTAYIVDGEDVAKVEEEVVKDGKVEKVVFRNKLIIAGNGKGKIRCNKNSAFLFADPVYLRQAVPDRTFSRVVRFTGLANLETGFVETMEAAFHQCASVTELDLSSWDVHKVKNMNLMFRLCKALTSLNTTGWATGSLETAHKIFSADFALASLNLNHWDTRNLRDISEAFSYCLALTDLQIGEWDTRNLETMNAMLFSDDGSGLLPIQSLDISKWDTRRLEDASYAFGNCTSLQSIDLNKWNTHRLKNTQSMFSGCFALTELDLSNWNTDNLVNANNMFTRCTGLTDLNLSGWTLDRATNVSYMFCGCYALQNLSVSNMTAKSADQMGYMFYGCENLATLDLSSLDTRSLGRTDDMFFGCHALAALTLGAGFDFCGAGFTRIVELPAPSAAYIPGADGRWYTAAGDAYLTEEVPSRVAATYYAVKPA